MKKLLTLFLLVSTLAAAGVKTNYFNASPMVVSNLLVQSGITLGGSNITAWSQIGGTSGTDSNTVNALIAAGTSLNASNWLGSTAFSNWLHTAFYPLTLNPSNYVSLAQVWSAGALTNNWTGGAIVLDAANANTNTFGGALVIGGKRWQANSGTAIGVGAWANNFATASGEGSWANFYALASGVGAWANYNATASGEGSWAMGGSIASNDNSFAWGGAYSHGAGSFNLRNPSLVWLDDTNLQTYLDGKANSNSVVSVIQTNSAGVAVTNQFTIGNANPTIVLPTISAAGGATTPATNDLRWIVDSVYPNTSNDLVGYSPNSFYPSQASATAPIVDGPTLYNAATNNWTMLLAMRYQREVTGSNLQWSVLRSGDSSTFTSNYTVRVVYTNTLTGAAWAGTLFTNTIASVNTWTNQTITDTVLTNLPVGSFPQLIFTVQVSATNGATTPAYWMIRNGGNQW
jgi:hypothetical protein